MAWRHEVFCQNAGQGVGNHFPDVGKMVNPGLNAQDAGAERTFPATTSTDFKRSFTIMQGSDYAGDLSPNIKAASMANVHI
jgi:hypothetical protein